MCGTTGGFTNRTLRAHLLGSSLGFGGGWNCTVPLLEAKLTWTQLGCCSCFTFNSVAISSSCHFPKALLLLLPLQLLSSQQHRVKQCFIHTEWKNREWPPGNYTHDVLGKCESNPVCKIGLISMTLSALVKKGRIGCFSSLLQHTHSLRFFLTYWALTHTHENTHI